MSRSSLRHSSKRMPHASNSKQHTTCDKQPTAWSTENGAGSRQQATSSLQPAACSLQHRLHACSTWLAQEVKLQTVATSVPAALAALTRYKLWKRLVGGWGRVRRDSVWEPIRAEIDVCWQGFPGELGAACNHGAMCRCLMQDAT